MILSFLLRGLLLGFSIAAPVGPIGVLCIRRTLANGRLSGFVSGLGAATADALYGSIAAFGLTTLSSLLVEQQPWLRLVGGGFLCYLGLRTFFSNQRSKELLVCQDTTNDRQTPSIPGTPGESPARWLAADYFSTFLLTITNPLTILSFAAVFTGLGIISTEQASFSALALVAGVFGVSTILTMLGTVMASCFGLSRLSFGRLERYSHALGGLVIFLCGGAIKWLGL